MNNDSKDNNSKLTANNKRSDFEFRNKPKTGLSVEIKPKKTLVFGRKFANKVAKETKFDKPIKERTTTDPKRGGSQSRLSNEEEAMRRRALELSKTTEASHSFFEHQPPKVKTKEEIQLEEAAKLAKSKTEKKFEKTAKELVSEKVSSPGFDKKGKAGQADTEDQSMEGKRKKKDRLFGAAEESYQDKKALRQGKLTISKALDEEDSDDSYLIGRGKSLAALKRKREKEKQQQQQRLSSKEKVIKQVTIPDFITVAELANRMAERTNEVVKVLMKLGVMARPTQELDAETAEIVVSEFGHNAKRVSDSSMEDELISDDSLPDTESRPAVVTIMGHVDHGKTTLLDTIRKTKVAETESGNITQHIGAYQIKTKKSELITFIDTPGHAAFSSMRARGADVTDIVILVVDAKEGVLPQTVEAINHTKAASKNIIIAINKIDLAGADPDKVKRQLLESEIVVEELGGDVIAVEVSAKSGAGIDKLIESISLLAEIMELKANSKKRGRAIVVESNLQKGKGLVATILVQNGTIHKGDFFVIGAGFGKVKTMTSDDGLDLKSAGPASPIEITGLQGDALPGDKLIVVDNEAKAKTITEYRQGVVTKSKNIQSLKAKTDNIFSNAPSEQTEDLALIIKADVQGSLQAIIDSIDKTDKSKINFKIIHKGIGSINESDIDLMAPLRGLVIAFNINTSRAILETAKKTGVEIRSYSLIYELIEDITKIITNLGEPDEIHDVIGTGRVKEIFDIGKVGKIAGCSVDTGVFKRSAKVRVLRGDDKIFEGKIKHLKHFKNDVREVSSGSECGLSIENFEEILVGDKVECYEVQIKEKLI